MLEELHTKICMDFDTDNNSHPMMENQLHRPIKVVTDTSDAVAQVMRVSSQEGFSAVSGKLDSIFAVVSKATLEKAVMQDFPMISTESRARNVQVPPTAIDAGSTEVNSLLQPLPSIAVNLNKLPAQFLVQLQ